MSGTRKKTHKFKLSPAALATFPGRIEAQEDSPASPPVPPDPVSPPESASPPVFASLDPAEKKILKIISSPMKGSALAAELPREKTRDPARKIICLIRKLDALCGQRPGDVRPELNPVETMMVEMIRSHRSNEPCSRRIGAELGLGPYMLLEKLADICRHYGEFTKKHGLVENVNAQGAKPAAPGEPSLP